MFDVHRSKFGGAIKCALGALCLFVAWSSRHSEHLAPSGALLIVAIGMLILAMGDFMKSS